jgi:hypothetical protein
MTSAGETPISVHIETGLPGTGRITVRTEPEHADDLRRSFDELGLPTTGDIVELSVPEVVTTVFEVGGILGSQLFVFAKALSLWFHRHDGKKIEITMNNQTLRLEGMNEAQAARTIRALRKEWDDKWREQFPERFPPDSDE